MPNASPHILLLIPAYNEETRIAPVLEDYANYFRDHHPNRFNMVVILNGCKDDTLGVVTAAKKKFPEISYVNIPESLNYIGKNAFKNTSLSVTPEADQPPAGLAVVPYHDKDISAQLNALYPQRSTPISKPIVLDTSLISSFDMLLTSINFVKYFFISFVI